VISSEDLRKIYTAAAGIVFIKSMPVVVGTLFKMFIKDTDGGDRPWGTYTSERP
jgi:hypothetical protein